MDVRAFRVARVGVTALGVGTVGALSAALVRRGAEGRLRPQGAHHPHRRLPRRRPHRRRRPVVDPTVIERMLHRGRHDTTVKRLNDREREVLALMAQGKSNTAIAARLVLGHTTVEFHVRSILTKLDLPENPDDNRRVQAVIWWLDAHG